MRISQLTVWLEADVATMRSLPIDAIMLPKSETAADIERAIRLCRREITIIALIESAAGLAGRRKSWRTTRPLPRFRFD